MLGVGVGELRTEGDGLCGLQAVVEVGIGVGLVAGF